MNFKNDTLSNPLLITLNDIGSNLKDNIVSKFKVTFPLNHDTMISLLESTSMKSYLNKKVFI